MHPASGRGTASSSGAAIFKQQITWFRKNRHKIVMHLTIGRRGKNDAMEFIERWRKKSQAPPVRSTSRTRSSTSCERTVPSSPFPREQQEIRRPSPGVRPLHHPHPRARLTIRSSSSTPSRTSPVPRHIMQKMQGAEGEELGVELDGELPPEGRRPGAPTNPGPRHPSRRLGRAESVWGRRDRDDLFRSAQKCASLLWAKLQATQESIHRVSQTRSSQGNPPLPRGRPGAILSISVLSGRVRRSSWRKTDGEVILAFLGPSEPRWERWPFSTRKSGARATVVTAEPSSLLILSGRQFMEVILQNPSIALSILRTLTRRLKDTSNNIANLIFLDTYSRVGSYRLLQDRRARGPEAGRRILRREPPAASRDRPPSIGSSRETVSRALKELEHEGLESRSWVRRSSCTASNRDGNHSVPAASHPARSGASISRRLRNSHGPRARAWGPDARRGDDDRVGPPF